MAWAALTEDEIKTRLSGPELTALKSKALADGQADPLPDVLAQVIDEIRGYISAWNQNTLGLAGTIPAQVRGAAIDIVRWRLAGRLAVGGASALFQSETRRKDYEDAIQLCKDIAAGKFAVEAPETPGPETIPGPDPEYGSETKLTF